MSLSPVRYPNLAQDGRQDKSQQDGRYNCIAWVVEDTKNWWWPHPLGTWPQGLPRENTVAAFVTMFQARGYAECQNGDLEEGFLKIALYALNGEPKHAARQLADGRWTSKMGGNIDIEHTTPHGIEGPYYGTVVKYFRKPV